MIEKWQFWLEPLKIVFNGKPRFALKLVYQ